MSPDLLLALRLADAADSISTPSFRSDSLRVETKADGSPVTEVDRAVEAAMQAMVISERPGDAFLGEEIGESGSGSRRWIFDGIDGTHNYAAGNPAWATMIALQVDGEITVGVVSSPAGGMRWFAERGYGAWRVDAEVATVGVTNFDGLEPRRIHVTATATLDGSTVLAVPPQGFMLGWRSAVAGDLARGAPTRTRTYAYHGAAVAEGEMDAVVILNGGPWDFAANTVIVEEAGGEYRDLWGGRRLDTTTMIFSNGKLTDAILDIAVPTRPDVHDVGVRDPEWRPQSAPTP
jgi:histidinol-phosphatase